MCFLVTPKPMGKLQLSPYSRDPGENQLTALLSTVRMRPCKPGTR